MIGVTAVNGDMRDHGDEIGAAIAGVLRDGRLLLGPAVEALEREVAAHLGVAGARAVASGTDALALALRAAGVEPGQGVLTVSQTAVATAAAVVLAGAVPVWVDVDDTATMDLGSLELAIAGAPVELAAIVPVHLYGRPAAMALITATADRHGLAVVEDCAQSYGAPIGERRCGSFGVAASLSFYPTKNLAGIGDGGMVVSDDRDLLDRVTALRQYGWDADRLSQVAGMNSRMDDVNAAVLRLRRRRVGDENERRRSIAARYAAALAGSPIEIVGAMADGHVFHQLVLRAPRRDDLARHLHDAGVGTAVHYRVPAHRHPAHLGHRPVTSLAVTDRLAGEVRSVPVHPWLTDSDVDRVLDALADWTP